MKFHLLRHRLHLPAILIVSLFAGLLFHCGKSERKTSELANSAKTTTASAPAADADFTAEQTESEDKSVPAGADQQRPARSVLAGPIQAEQFDAGGADNGFHLNPQRGGRRTEPEIKPLPDSSGSYVGNLKSEDWLAYKLEFPRDGIYDVDLRGLDNDYYRQCDLLVDDQQPVKLLKFDFETSSETLRQATARNVAFTSGTHLLKLKVRRDGAALDWFEIIPVNHDWQRGTTTTAAIHTIWRKDGADAAGTTVTLRGRTAAGERWYAAGVTDAQGQLVRPVPADATQHVLNARHELGRRNVLREFTPGEPVTVALELSTSIYGNVIFVRRKLPVAGAEVRILETNQKTRADAAGRFQLGNIERRVIRVTATKDRYSSFSDEEEILKINLIPDELNGPFDLLLDEGSFVSGFVLDEASLAPVAGAKLQAAPLNSASRENYQAQSDAQGFYELAGLYEDGYTFMIKADNYVDLKLIVNLALEKKIRYDFQLEKGAELQVLVTDPQERPLAGATVMKVYENESSTSLVPQTDDTGRMTARGLSLKRPPKIAAFKQGYIAGQPVELEKKSATEFAAVTLKLAPQTDTTAQSPGKGKFVGRVTDMQQKPLAHAGVKWMQPWMTANPIHETLTDAEGAYALELDGTSTTNQESLVVECAGYAPLRRAGVKPGTLEAPNEQNFQLEPGHWLEVRIFDEKSRPISGISVSVRADTNDNFGYYELPNHTVPKITDAAGALRFDDLPGPTVKLSLNGKGWTTLHEQVVDVDQTTSFVLTPDGVIAGVVLDKETEQPVREFNIKTSGDLIDDERSRGGENFTHAAGRFKLTNLQLDSPYELTVSAKDYTTAVARNVTAEREGQAAEHKIFLSKGETILVELFDRQTNEPLAGRTFSTALMNSHQQFLQISWSRLDSNYNSLFRDFQRITTDDAGRAAFTEGEEQRAILINIEGYERTAILPDQRHSYESGDGKVLRVGLNQGGELFGVYYRNQEPRPGANVHLNKQEVNRYEDFENAQTGAAGDYRFTRLTAGQYQVTAGELQAEDFGYRSMSRRVMLEKSESKEVNLGNDLGPFRLYGRILDNGRPLNQAYIHLSNQFNWDYIGFNCQTLAEGKYEISGLRPGMYSVSLSWFNRGGSDSRSRNEIINIQGDLEQDFELSGGNKVTGRLVFPAGTSAQLRNRYNYADLQFIGNFQQAQQNQIEQHKNAQVRQERLEFSGRFQGKYRLQLQYNRTNNQATQVQIPGEFTIDNLEHDVDLGEIHVPLNGSVRFTLNFARPADRRHFTQAQITTLKPNWYQAPNPEGITYNASAAIPNGSEPVVMPGRFRGDYRVALLLADQAYFGQNNFVLPDIFQIAEPEADNDLGVIAIPPVNKVFGKLVFQDQETRSNFQLAQLIRSNFNNSPAVDPDAISQMGNGRIAADDTFTIHGRFRGDYGLTLLPAAQNFQSQMRLPETYALNNLDGDQDLGEILVGAFGRIKILLTHTSTLRPLYMIAWLGDDPNIAGMNMLQINPNLDEQTVGPVISGTHTLHFLVPGFKVEASSTQVTVSETQTPEIQVRLIPEGMLIFTIINAGDQSQAVPVQTATLAGPGTQRTLVPQTGAETQVLSLWSSNVDLALTMNNKVAVAFHNLSAGDYQLTVVAEGYETYQAQYHVEPGVFNAEGGMTSIMMNPLTPPGADGSGDEPTSGGLNRITAMHRTEMK